MEKKQTVEQDLPLSGKMDCGTTHIDMKDAFEEEEVSQLELSGLRRTLEWTQIQRERLLDQLDLLRLENQRLQDRIEDLERLVAELRQQERLF